MHLALTLRLALRGLRADRATSLSAVAILALGLAAPATFFSLLWGGGLRSLPVPEGQDVVRVEIRLPSASGRELSAGAPDLAVLERAPALASVGAFRPLDLALGSEGRGTYRVPFAEMTPSTFPLLAVAPALGRLPTGAEADQSVILGYRTWVDVFDADPNAIGTRVTLGQESRIVTAIMPDGFAFPFNHHGWTIAEPLPGSTGYEAVGRLAEGATEASASAQIQQLWTGSDLQRPTEVRGATARVRNFTSGRGEGGEAIAFGGLVLVGLCLLLIAIANTANLLLVRAADRVRVLAVQSALGASRLQLASQLFAEALLLALVGGLAGLALTTGMVDFVQSTGSKNFGYYWMRMAVDAPVLVFTSVLVLGTAMCASMLPVGNLLRLDIQAVLKGGRTAAPGRFGGVGRFLVGGQLALACGALVAAALTSQALGVARDFGGDLPGDQVLIATLDLPDESYATGDSRAAGMARIEDAVRSLPGVREVAIGLGSPGYFESFGRLEVEGITYERPEDQIPVMVNAVSPGFDGVLDIGLQSGRRILPSDGPDDPRVAVVSQSLANLLASEGEVTGRRIRAPALDPEWATVVGVVDDIVLAGGPGEVVDRVHFSAAQFSFTQATLMVRSGGAATLVAGAVRAAVWEADSDVALSGIQSLAEGHRFMTRAQSTLNTLGATGGAAGLLVSIVGLFALLSFHVRQRTAELGVRMALGADGHRIVLEVMGLAAKQLIPAIFVGSLVAWVVAPALGPLLLGADPRGWTTYALVAAVFLTTGMSAALLPALRAARTDPARALGAD